MRLFGCVSEKLVKTGVKWLAVVLALAFGIRIYYVREMVAALMIFSIFFAAAAAAVLVLFMLDVATKRLTALIEAGVLRAIGARQVRYAEEQK